MSEAARVMQLHQRTGMPVLDCQRAIREAPGDELAYLRRVHAGRQPKGTTWAYPTGLQVHPEARR